MKTILILIVILFSLAGKAQIVQVSLQASGLTCSMCSNSINKALKTLDFVLRIDADIKTYTFEIFFKPNSIVDFNLIRKKVENAGFTVSSFIATILFDNVGVKPGQLITVANNYLLFTAIKDRLLNGLEKIKILDKGFVSANEYKKNSFPISSTRTYNVTL